LLLDVIGVIEWEALALDRRGVVAELDAESVGALIRPVDALPQIDDGRRALDGLLAAGLGLLERARRGLGVDV